MISFLKGTLYETRPDSIVVDVNGVGYEVIIHARVLSHLPPEGQAVLLYTYLQVLENEFKIYGFADKEEQEMFKTLLSVSGIGPKVALNILAFTGPLEFYRAIISSDEKLLTRIPGIGKKTAQRLIFELKEKISSESIPEVKSGDESGISGIIDEVMEALEALGYSRSETFGQVMELQNNGQLTENVAANVKHILRKKAGQIKG